MAGRETGSTRAQLYASEDFPGTGGCVIPIAHGANNSMDNPLIVGVSGGLAERGHAALPFNFPYREAGRKSPDAQKVLEAAWLGVFQYASANTGVPPERLVAGGKSMGGRVAAQLAGSGRMSPAGLVFFGYPLHAPGKKDCPRADHLYSIKCPMLFFAGTRDPLCDIEVLRGIIAGIDVPVRLHTVEGGDHGFKLPKSADTGFEEVVTDIVEKTARWLWEIADRQVRPSRP
ncbi:MAG: alpha/beta family hydrolase [Desulfatibacillaceae bacterium]